VLPEIRRKGRWRMAAFTFAAPVRDITLLSSTACPADTDPDSEDRRELGVCLGRADRLSLGQGFYPRGTSDDGVWMGKTGALQMHEPGTTLTLSLAAIVQSWVRPPIDAGLRGG
jgi:hypothetical protein